ncbi:MAG: Maf family protein [Pseudomonadota bacterium]
MASGSASRRTLLKQAGVTARSIKPNIDEETVRDAMRQQGAPIREQAMHLAELKALKVSSREAGLVIGGDQMLALGDIALDKPIDLAGAKQHLLSLSGKDHILETAILVAERGQVIWRHLARPRLSVRPLSEAFIDDYIAECGPSLLQTVGAYQLEGPGAQLFTKIDGDYFSILGLPLLPLLDYLRTREVLQT